MVNAAMLQRRRRRRRTASAAFDFGSISGLVADWDPNSLAGANGSNATPLANKTGLSATLDLLSNAGDEFTIQTPGGAVSGKVVRGQGAGANGGKSGLYTSGAVQGTTFSSGISTVFALVKFANASDQTYLEKWNEAGGSQMRLFLNGSGSLVFRHGNSSSDVSVAFSDTTNWHVIDGRCDADSLDLDLGVDGVTTTAAGNGDLLTVGGTDTLYIACRAAGNVFGLQGDMRRFLIYNRKLTNLERATVRTQLGLLAGLTL